MNNPLTEYVVRPARDSDLPALLEMKRLAGPGLTSLAGPDELIAGYLAESARAFTGALDAHRYLMALVHRLSGAVVGLCQVKTQIGVAKPFFNYRILRIAQASAAARRRFDLDILVLVNEFAGCTEVGALFVRPEHRHAGVGRALARARYLLMASAPERFGARVLAELRGVVSAAGESPFWTCLNGPFFQMRFEEADELSATTDNQFILDLMPKYPIYIALLAQEAREAIGRVHPEGEGARKMLEEEGFRYEGVIDIFDGGPVVTAPREAIETVKRAHRRPMRAGGAGGALALIAAPGLPAFRVAAAAADDCGDHVRIDAAALAALELNDGEEALVRLGP